MKDQILKIAGVKSEKEFYKKFPTEEAFMAKHGKALKKAAMGSKMVKTQLQQLTDFGNPPKFQNAPYGIGLNTGTALGANPTGSFDWTMGANVPITGGTPPPTLPGGNAQGMYQVSDFDRTGIQKDIMSTMGKQKFDLLGKLGGPEGIANMAGGVIQGIQGEKNWKKQKKASEAAKNISALTLRAARSRPNEPLRRYYNRPESMVINPEELFPTYGVGSNVLSSAKDGTMIGGNPTEIQNMYNPGDLYSNLGYEPMSESDIIKQYEEGGYIRKAQLGDIIGQMGGMSGVIGKLGGITGTGADSSGLVSSIGSIGSKLLPGAAGSALGPLSAFAQFAINDQRARTLKNNAEAAQRNLQTAGLESGIQGLQGQYGTFMKNGGGIPFSQDGSVFPDRSDYMDYEEGYQEDVDKYLSNLPTSQPSSQTSETKKSEAEKTTKLNPYEGVSVYDFLQAQGKAGDYRSRKQLAKKLGIEGYEGTPGQNKQMMEMIRQNPDVLTDYVQSTIPSGGTKSKTVSTSKKEKTSSPSSKAAAAKPSESENIWNYKSAYDFGTPTQTFVSASSTPVNKNTPGYGKKSDPYARIVEKSVRDRGMTDYSTQQYFNEQLQKTLGEVAVSGLLPGVSAETIMPYYGARAIPYVTATARNARRAIPYATRAIGYENGGDLPLYDEGGWVSHTWQPQVITKFGDVDVSQIHSIATEGMDTLRTGGRITQNNMYETDQFNFGGQLQTTWGGRAEPISYNPYLPGSGETVMFKGNSHEESDKKGRTGIGVKYGNNGDYSPYMEYGRDGVEDVTDVEVERGEPATELQDSTGDTSMVVFGNLKIPKQFIGEIGDDSIKYGEKFKTYANRRSKDEAKQNKIIDKASELIDIHDDGTPFGELAMNSAKAMIDGANQTLKNIAQFKKNAAAVQNAINETAEENMIDADALAKGKIKIDKEAMKQQAKWGKIVEKAEDGVKKKPSKTSALETVRKGQHKSGKYYGNVTEEQYKQLVENNKDWFDFTGFDPSKKADVKRFQEQFNQISKIIGSNARLKEDALLGEQTASAKVEYSGDQPTATVEKKTETTTSTTGPTTTIVPALPTKEKKKPDWLSGLNTLLPYLQRPYEEPMDMAQLYPEMMALSMNVLEPVKAQGVQSLLETPYDISLQDQLNEITASERAAQKMAMGDPSAMANISAQSQAAKQKVLADQFRMNQAMKSDVYGRNRAALNQAQRENLAIFADQEAKQQMAKSKTKATALEAMGSMADKIAKQKLENRTLAAYSNLFPNYRFTGDMRALPTGLTLFETPKVGSVASAIDTKEKTSKKKKTEEEDDETSTGKKGKILKKNNFNGSIVRALKNI